MNIWPQTQLTDVTRQLIIPTAGADAVNGTSVIVAVIVWGGPKKRGHSVLQKYCSDLHDFFAEIKVV